MVFFVCEACNETLKKNQVEKHTFKCRQCSSVTCVDCSVSFYGNDYEKHITCVSEAEKYEKTLYKAKKVKANPQDAWISIIEQAALTAPTNLKTHMVKLKEFSNIPRNKNKFINFCKNSLRLNSDTLLGSLWDFIDTCRPVVPVVAVEKKISETVDSKLTNDNDKKRKIEEGNDNNEADNKKKKKKSKSDDKPDDIIPTIISDEVEEVVTDNNEKKKKKKKSKKDINQNIAVDESPIEPAVVVEQELKKKKKDKKNKKDKKENKGNNNNNNNNNNNDNKFDVN